MARELSFLGNSEEIPSVTVETENLEKSRGFDENNAKREKVGDANHGQPFIPGFLRSRENSPQNI